MNKLLLVWLLLASSVFAGNKPWTPLASDLVISSKKVPVTVVGIPSDSTIIVHVDGRGDLLLMANGLWDNGYLKGDKWIAVPKHFSVNEHVVLEIYLVAGNGPEQRHLALCLVPLVGNGWGIPIKSVQTLHATNM
jgi:hypothetical protein